MLCLQQPLQMMNGVLELYSGACDMFVRPQRTVYTTDMLGPVEFKLGGDSFVREDLTIENERGLKLECSHFYHKKYSNINLGDLSELSIKKLKVICTTYKIDIRQCVEKSDIIRLIREKCGEDHTAETQAAPCIIYLHGNCGCRLDSLDAIEVTLLYGFSLFAVDLSGSGLSEGEYISLGFYEEQDVKAIVKYLKQCPFVSNIGLWGRSMGAATSILYTSKNPGDISSIILDSPFSDLYTLSSEVVQQMNLGVPKWVVNSGFSLVMQMIRRSVKQKADFDLYAVAPIDHVEHCHVPAIFIHGEQDDFVLPKHSLTLCEKYEDKRKEILLVSGDHNAPRPIEAFNYISLFLHRYLLAESKKEKYPTALKVFGNTDITKNLDCFYCKQIKGFDLCSVWPHNVVIGVGRNFIRFITPYTETVTHTYQFAEIMHVSVREEQNIFIMGIRGHVDCDPGSTDHTSGILAFYSSSVAEIYATIERKAKT